MMRFERPAFMDDPELRAFEDSVGRFFERHAPREVTERWRDQGFVDRAFWTKAGEAGLLGATVPVDYGGAGADFRYDVVLLEQIKRHEVSGFAAGLHNVIVVPYVVAHGTEEQKRRWLPRLVSGELVAAIAMTEPDAGSDLQSITTTAVRDGDHYRLSGAKTFISNGAIADFVVVVAKTDPGARGSGISLLVVETHDTAGFRRGRRLDKIGMDAQDTSELFFDDVLVPVDNLLGGVEGRGFIQLMQELPRERLAIAIGAAETAEIAVQDTLRYVGERKAFGKPIAAFQNTQFKLAEAAANAMMAKVFTYHCIERLLAGTLDNALSAMAKLRTSEIQSSVVDECLQLHGGFGYVNEYRIARMYRDARVDRIYGGSNEIMKLIIARAIADPRAG
ncbi:acyl-CoA dehydrogenase family protein [Sphingomonas sp.]|uniref:acyl-CoA dehydrogenase family protein n=1 Tax=Sphingomonas sp. TaxID=28214 RepID=UPI002DD68B07|nr:acyl-CoA dehydrogenase family protein [Sphingomonas sp.]